MELSINSYTIVEIESNVAIFRLTQTDKKSLEKIIYVNKHKIFGAELTYTRFFNVRSLVIFIIIGIIGGGGFWGYQTYAGQVPDMLIIGAIIGVLSVVGVFRAFQKKRSLVVVVETDDFSILTKNRFSFPIDKSITDEKVEDLMYKLVT